jgi:hypothetical protein
VDEPQGWTICLLDTDARHHLLHAGERNVTGISIKGGDKLEAALRKIAAGLSNGASVEVGFMGGATYPDGTSVPLVAAFNEFGVPSHGQPPRPFFRNAIAKGSPVWPKNIATALKSSDYDAARALDLVGVSIEDEIRMSITELVSPPLAQSTIDRKGFPKPLIDTGTLLGSVTHRVTKEK